MHGPLVSVIIPNYCHSKYLDQRIQSVLDQTYQNFEIIILDDCSPDDGASRNVIEKYRNNPHVSHIEYNEVNSGSTFKQWRKGFELAKGELLWLAESDDYCDKDFLQTATTLYVNNKDIAVVYCTSQLVDENNDLLCPIYKRSNKSTVYTGEEFIKKRMLHKNEINNASSAVFNREKALRLNLDYMSYVAAGDYLFWVHLAETGGVIHIVDPKNCFRQHRNKVSPKKQKDGTVTREVHQIIQYLKVNGYVSKVQDFIISVIYIVQTHDLEIETEELRKELMLLWNHGGKIPYWFAKLFLKIHFKFR